MAPKGLQFSSVKVRLAIWILGVQTVVLLCLGTTLYYVAHASLLASIDRQMADRAHLRPPEMRWASHMGNPPPLKPGMKRPACPPMPPKPRPVMPSRSYLLRFRPRLFDLNGFGVGHSSDSLPWDSKTFSLSKKGQSVCSVITYEGETARVLSEPVRIDGKIVGVIQIAHSLTEMNRDLSALFEALLMLIPLALIVTGLSSVFLIGRLMRPVRNIRCAAESIGAEDLSRRLPVVGNDEFSRLSVTFNDMLSRLERAFDRQRRFTADASHELKTPLTVIKANTSLALIGKKTPEQYASHIQAVDRAANLMGRIVQDLLLLARSDAGQLSFAMEPISVADVLKSAIEQVEKSGDTPIELLVSDPSPLVMGDSAQLIRLFSNLLDNSRRHTPADGRISVTAKVVDRSVTIEVRDTGEGITAEHLPHVCERFYRVDASRTRQMGGTGLGLPISSSIAMAHGGELLIDSIYGMGTVAKVVIPQAHDALSL